MFSSIRKIFSKQESSSDSKKINTNTIIGATIGGPTKIKPIKVEEKVLQNITPTLFNKTSEALIPQPTQKQEELATIFSNGDYFDVYNNIKDYFKKENGVVDKRIWLMLLDLLQILNNRREFDKTSLAYAHFFETSPPSWYSSKIEEDTLSAGNSVIFLDSIPETDLSILFKKGLQDAKNENFCRFNIGQFKFEKNPIENFKHIIKFLQDLRKNKIPTVLMGDNNLVNFSNKIMADTDYLDHIHPSFKNNENIVWLAHLEILQWKKNSSEFDAISLAYAEKFEMSPPDWEEPEIALEFKSAEKKDDNIIFYEDNELNIGNVETLVNLIQKGLLNKLDVTIDISNIEKIDFSVVGVLSYKIQEILSTNSNLKINFINPNEFIIVILQMLGIDESIKILPRKRN